MQLGRPVLQEIVQGHKDRGLRDAVQVVQNQGEWIGEGFQHIVNQHAAHPPHIHPLLDVVCQQGLGCAPKVWIQMF